MQHGPCRTLVMNPYTNIMANDSCDRQHSTARRESSCPCLHLDTAGCPGLAILARDRQIGGVRVRPVLFFAPFASCASFCICLVARPTPPAAQARAVICEYSYLSHLPSRTVMDGLVVCTSTRPENRGRPVAAPHSLPSRGSSVKCILVRINDDQPADKYS